jgi:hypothetical protein
LQRAAEEFWRSRNVNGPGLSVDVADDIGDESYAGSAVLGGGKAVLNSHLAGTLLANARNGKYSVRGRRRNLNRLGELISHEAGHAYGLDHTDTGLMGPSSALGNNAPADLQSLVRRLIPRNKKPNAHDRSPRRLTVEG